MRGLVSKSSRGLVSKSRGLDGSPFHSFRPASSTGGRSSGDGWGRGKEMAVWSPSRSMNLHRWLRCSPSSAGSSSATVAVAWRSKKGKTCLLAANCTPLQQSPDIQQQVEEEEAGIMCDSCDGRGWLLCDFCEGKKTYVKAENNRIYRRCPTCRAIGYVVCAKCKVFKCITFPDYRDGEL